MKIGEQSRVTAKYLDPKAFLESMFPTSRECRQCHTMIELERPKDVYHSTYSHEHAAYRKDWLEWSCPVCKQRNQFTSEEILVNTHRRMIRSRHDMAECVLIAIIAVFALLWFYSWTFL